uniref:Phospholipid/glycerol acyltransferase domain-containing protein n=1 Tax=Clastoptera arizonana TaxID=38151 RepID=A0A1B6ECR7_9HEMI
MAFVITFISDFFLMLQTPLMVFILFILLLISFGKSFGIRRIYVAFLLKIFELYGKEKREKKNRSRQNSNSDINTKTPKVTVTLGNDKNNEVSKKSTDGGVDELLKSNCENQCGDLEGNNNSNNITNNGENLIKRENLILSPIPELNYVGNNNLEIENKSNCLLPRNRSYETLKQTFDLSDCLEYVKAGVEAIIEDQVTSRFEAEELKSWNLLTRTNHAYEFISWRLTFIWIIGFIIRYCFLLPSRIAICFFGVMLLTVSTALVGYFPEGKFKKWLNYKVSIICFGVLSSALSSVINYHNTENRPKSGICVANHTSPIDVLVLMCDNCYSLIGQRHGGFLGVLQRALARASPHIWFERSEVKDREAVAVRLRKHVSDPNNPPILIFPEGTCINNTSVMQFKKGSFEVGGVIYPVAIKYDPRFGDAFWNSSRYSMMQYLYMMMSSWAIVCDIWYLPPMYQELNESAIDFANRVKRVIAKQGGLVDLVWDGQLKRMKPKKEWKEKQQEEFSKRLKVN